MAVPKTKRLIELMMTINAKKSFTVRELADEFNVSTRTIMRDLQELSELGMPLYSEVGPHGGFRILHERVLPPISFTESEAVSLFFASQSLRHYSSLPFEAESHTALKKFFHFLPGDIQKNIQAMQDRVMFWTPERQASSPFLRDILDAALDQRVIRVEYDSKSRRTKRKLQPIGIFSENGYWYCPAYCFKRKEIRLFRADRMHSVEVDEQEVPRDEISAWTINKLLHNRYANSDQNVVLKVKLTRKGVRTAQSDPWLEKQIKINSDGSGVIEAQLPGTEIAYYADYFFGLGMEAKVETPQEMISAIRRKISDMQMHYNR